MQYRWKSGARATVPAQVVGEVCAELEQKGQLTAQNLVDVSRPEDAPLHKAFEWDDSVAAEKYRESQGRYLIRCVEVVRESSEPVRAFISLTRTASTHEYHSIDAVLKSKDDTADMLARAKSELDAFARKYANLEELAEVFQAIERLNSEVQCGDAA